MKKVSQRATRVGDQIQKELADLLRNEVKDPRVGPVTVTHVDVTSDLSHATVHFTHLAGREKAAETLAALARTSGFLRSALSHRLDLYSVPQLHFVVRRFDRVGHADLAADRRRDSSRQEAGIGISDGATRRAPGARAGASTACCCWTSRRACPPTRRCSAPSARSTPKRPATPGRSTRSRRDCSRCASARRPSSRNSCSTPPNAIRPRCASASRRRPAMQKGEVLEMRPVALARSDVEAVLPDFTGRLAQVPPAFSALKFEGRSHYEYARAGIDVPRPPRDDRDPRPLAARVECAGRRARRHVQQGHLYPRPGRGHRPRAGLRRASRGIAADRDRRVRYRRCGHAGATGSDDARTNATAALLPAAALLRDLPTLRLGAADAARFRQGAAVLAPGSADGACAAFDGDVLLGVAFVAAGLAQPRRVVAAASGSKRRTWLKSKRFSGYNPPLCQANRSLIKKPIAIERN